MPTIRPILAALDSSAWDKYGEPVLSTLLIGAVAILMLGVSIFLMEKMTPFSIRKELEEDQNNSVAIVVGAVVIGVALVIAAVARA